jgi:hypothetical protein
MAFQDDGNGVIDGPVIPVRNVGPSWNCSSPGVVQKFYQSGSSAVSAAVN